MGLKHDLSDEALVEVLMLKSDQNGIETTPHTDQGPLKFSC